MIPSDVAILLTNPWGSQDELVEWELHQDAIGACWLTGAMHLQDFDGTIDLEIAEIIEILYAARRWDAVNCPVFFAN